MKQKRFIVTIDYQDIEPTEKDLNNVLAQVINKNIFHVTEIENDNVVTVDYQEE